MQVLTLYRAKTFSSPVRRVDPLSLFTLGGGQSSGTARPQREVTLAGRLIASALERAIDPVWLSVDHDAQRDPQGERRVAISDMHRYRQPERKLHRSGGVKVLQA